MHLIISTFINDAIKAIKLTAITRQIIPIQKKPIEYLNSPEIGRALEKPIDE